MWSFREEELTKRIYKSGVNALSVRGWSPLKWEDNIGNTWGRDGIRDWQVLKMQEWSVWTEATGGSSMMSKPLREFSENSRLVNGMELKNMICWQCEWQNLQLKLICHYKHQTADTHKNEINYSIAKEVKKTTVETAHKSLLLYARKSSYPSEETKNTTKNLKVLNNAYLNTTSLSLY